MSRDPMALVADTTIIQHPLMEIITSFTSQFQQMPCVIRTIIHLVKHHLLILLPGIKAKY